MGFLDNNNEPSWFEKLLGLDSTSTSSQKTTASSGYGSYGNTSEPTGAFGGYTYGKNDETRPLGTTSSGYGGQLCLSTDQEVESRLSGIGYIKDNITGIEGKTAIEAYYRAKKRLNTHDLAEFVQRIEHW